MHSRCNKSAGSGELEKLDDISVRVFEGRNPAAPSLSFRGTDEFHAGVGQPAVQGVDIIHAEMGHDAEWIPGLPVDAVMEAEVEADSAEFQSYVVAMIGVKGDTQSLVIEAEQPVEVVSPEGYSYYSCNHWQYPTNSEERTDIGNGVSRTRRWLHPWRKRSGGTTRGNRPAARLP